MRSPLFLKAVSLRQIGGACKKCDFCARSGIIKGQKQKAWFLLLRKIISRGGHVRLCTFPCACLVSARSAPFCTVLHGSVRASVRFEEGGFTPFHHTARAVQGAKAKSVVFAFARYYRNRARSPLFLRAERFRQIECAYSKCDFETRRKLFYKVYLLQECIPAQGGAY